MISLYPKLVLAANLLALAVYSGASLYFIAKAWRQHQLSRKGLQWTAAIALLLHSVGVHGLSFAHEGFYLSYFGISSLIFLVINLLVLISSLKKDLHNLFLLLFPLSALVVLASTLEASADHHLLDYSLATHVILSILAYSLFALGALLRSGESL